MLKPQDLVGSYRVLRFLGPGGMGSVYEVRHEVMGTHHALKLLADQYLNNPGVRERFTREAQLMFGLGVHPNIVRATDPVHQRPQAQRARRLHRRVDVEHHREVSAARSLSGRRPIDRTMTRGKIF
jgi:hypothetical protein